MLKLMIALILMVTVSCSSVMVCDNYIGDQKLQCLEKVKARQEQMERTIERNHGYNR